MVTKISSWDVNMKGVGQACFKATGMPTRARDSAPLRASEGRSQAAGRSECGVGCRAHGPRHGARQEWGSA